MKKALKKIKAFVRKHPTATIVGATILLLLMLSQMCGCSGTSGPSKQVDGIYEITSGTQHAKDGNEEFTEDITGYYLVVNQGGKSVSSLGCIGTLTDNQVKCDNSRTWSIDPWLGPVEMATSGTIKFENERIVVKTHTDGFIPVQNYVYELDFDFTAKLYDMDDLSSVRNALTQK